MTIWNKNKIILFLQVDICDRIKLKSVLFKYLINVFKLNVFGRIEQGSNIQEIEIFTTSNKLP